MITISQNGSTHAIDEEGETVTLCKQKIEESAKINEFSISCPVCLSLIEERFSHFYKYAKESALDIMKASN